MVTTLADLEAEVEEVDPLVVGEGALRGICRFEDVVFGLRAHEVPARLIREIGKASAHRHPEHARWLIVTHGGERSHRHSSDC